MALLFNYSRNTVDRIGERMRKLYGDDNGRLMERLRMMVGRYGVGISRDDDQKAWSSEDVVLITYGDMVQEPTRTPLSSLLDFTESEIGDAINTVHILPFYPYSSDDGFSVIDYRQVDENLGSWKDVNAISSRYHLMADLVLNHISSKSSWFRNYIVGTQPFTHYFHEGNPANDYSGVTRPRTSPLLTRVATRDGERHVWTTFSADQIDLNFSNPEVLFDILDVLFVYIAQGARVIRMDAIAYLWKTEGTSCIHLPETHEIVKIFRDILNMVAPKVVLLTETNVPHQENISYFGEGDEAHMVYQFALPPLLLHALIKGTSQYLTQWASSLGDIPDGCTYLNFTASHDGVGVRPLEGLVPDVERDQVVDRVRQLGGEVSSKANPDGSESAYELNITYFDALGDPSVGFPSDEHMARFLCSQTIMLSLQGVPAIYFNSLFGARNHPSWTEETGRARTINREKWDRETLHSMIHEEGSHYTRVFSEYKRRLYLRRGQPAFHPFAKQKVYDLGPSLFCFERVSLDGGQTIVCIFNLTGKSQRVDLKNSVDSLAGCNAFRSLLQGTTRGGSDGVIKIKAWSSLWLTK